MLRLDIGGGVGILGDVGLKWQGNIERILEQKHWLKHIWVGFVTRFVTSLGFVTVLGIFHIWVGFVTGLVIIFIWHIWVNLL